MTNFSRRQVLSLPMAASVVGAGAAGAAYAADSNSKVNAPDFDAIEDRMTLLTKRGASLSIRQKHLAVLSVAAGLGFEDLGERTAAAALADGLVVRRFLYPQRSFDCRTRTGYFLHDCGARRL